ncbi:MAG TPA: LPS export ABC transporter permease LptF [Oceanospirillaceae bacterium]|nr:LPS export ABC transporter permease LptF [Oceanospirillaceae bacterium]
MRILTSYIAKEIIITSLVIAIVLLLVVGSSRFAYFLSLAVAGELNAQAVLVVIANLLPAYLSNLLPMGTFIGVLVALGRLSVDNELVVLSANGVSQWRLVGIIAIPVGALAMVVLLLSTAIAPHTSRVVEEVLYVQSHTSEFESIVPGKFQGNGNRQAIYAESLNADKSKLHNVFLYTNDGSSAPVIIKAETATQYFDEDYQAKYLLLQNGSRMQVADAERDVSLTQFQSMAVQLLDTNVAVDITHSFTIPTLDLLDSPKATYRAQLYWRFSLPLMTLIICLTAIALSRVNPRQGRFSRLLPALVLFLAYLSLLMRFRDQIEMGVKGAELSVVLLHSGYLLLGLWLLFGPKFPNIALRMQRADS